MRTLPAHLARASVPLSLYRLDSLIEIQRHMPQQECPLVSEGHKAHHDDDHHDDDHDDNIDGEHLQQWLTQPIGHTIDNHTLPHQKIYNTPYTK